MALSDYLNINELNLFFSNSATDEETLKIQQSMDNASAQKMLSTNMAGVEAIPYQFMENVDRRVTGTSVGRKYAEKIHSRLPLLFLTPCKPLFMDDFSSNDKKTITNFLIDKSVQATDELINGKGKYYSVEFDYSDYYKYLNCMLSAVSVFLNIQNEEITVGPNNNRRRTKIRNVNWQNELNDSFKTFFSADENLIFYLDGMQSVSESYSNDTTESSLASQINGFADSANEISFLLGGKNSLMANLADSAAETTSSVMSSLSTAVGNLGGGIVQSLAENGVNTVVNGGKIIFPKIWSNSSFTRSYSLDIKLRSPDHDSLSIFLNVIKPYCKLLALTLPHAMDNNVNAFDSPFLVKAYSKGLFNIDMGIITSMNVTKGAQCCWNDDGLPTQIDITIEIEDLYSNLTMSKTDSVKNMSQMINNTSYLDYLANMAGLNIAQMEIGRRVKMFYYLGTTSIVQTPSRLFTRMDQGISNVIGNLYKHI